MKKFVQHSHLELLSILCMLMIFCEHLGLVVFQTTMEHQLFHALLQSFTQVGLPCFLILLGYQTIRLRVDRFFSLVGQMLFYSITLAFCAFVLGRHSFALPDILYAVFPFGYRPYGLLTGLLLLFLIAPVLNKATLHLSRVAYIVMLLLGFIGFYILPFWSTLPVYCDCKLCEGYRLVHFVYLYLLGHYFRLHSIFVHSARYYFGWYVLSTLLLFVQYYCYEQHTACAVLPSSQVPLFFAAVTLFFTFRQLPFQSRPIHHLTSGIYASFLVFFSPYVLPHVLPDVWMGNCPSAVPLALVLVAVPLLIYFVSYVIEILRRTLLGHAEQTLIHKIEHIGCVQYLVQHYLRLLK